jgi:ABC-type nitrate/sulfonate/bicarbonate transport system permease component
MNREKIFYILLGFVLLILLWILGNFALPDKVPTILEVLNSLKADFLNAHFPNVLTTAKISVLGLLFALSISFIIVFVISLFPKFEFVITPLVIMLKATPVVAFIPIIVTFFSLSSKSLVFSSALVCFFPLVISGIDGIKRVPKKLLVFSKVYNAGKIDSFIHFSSRYIIESMLSGLKISAPLSLIGTLVGQFLIGGKDGGLGVYIQSHTGPYNEVPSFISILLASILGSIFYGIAYLIHHFYAKSIYINK